MTACLLKELIESEVGGMLAPTLPNAFRMVAALLDIDEHAVDELDVRKEDVRDHCCASSYRLFRLKWIRYGIHYREHKI